MTKGYNGDKNVAKMHDEWSRMKFLSHKGTIISKNNEGGMAEATLADEDILEKSEKIARGLAYMIFFL